MLRTGRGAIIANDWHLIFYKTSHKVRLEDWHLCWLINRFPVLEWETLIWINTQLAMSCSWQKESLGFLFIISLPPASVVEVIVTEPSVCRCVCLGLLDLRCAPSGEYRTMLCTIDLRCAPPRKCTNKFVRVYFKDLLCQSLSSCYNLLFLREENKSLQHQECPLNLGGWLADLRHTSSCTPQRPQATPGAVVYFSQLVHVRGVLKIASDV